MKLVSMESFDIPRGANSSSLAHHPLQRNYFTQTLTPAFCIPHYKYFSNLYNMYSYLPFLLVALLIHANQGFAPPAAATKKHSRAAITTFRPANFVSAAVPSNAAAAVFAATPFVILRMAAAENDEDSTTSMETKISADGTFYDDEVRCC